MEDRLEATETTERSGALNMSAHVEALLVSFVVWTVQWAPRSRLRCCGACFGFGSTLFLFVVGVTIAVVVTLLGMIVITILAVAAKIKLRYSVTWVAALVASLGNVTGVGARY